MAKIFYVEDDANLSLVVKECLEVAGHQVFHFTKGDEAMVNFARLDADLCILDVMLPGVDGFSIAKAIRSLNPSIPIIFISARLGIEDKLNALNIGADDYIFKPFSIEEVLLKVKIFFKRKSASATDDSDRYKPAQIGIFLFDYFNYTLSFDQTEIKLTQRESELIRFFLKNANKVIKREDILIALWGQDDYFLGRSLDVFISKIRKHFQPDPNIKIETIPRVGFRFHY